MFVYTHMCFKWNNTVLGMQDRDKQIGNKEADRGNYGSDHNNVTVPREVLFYYLQFQ